VNVVVEGRWQRPAAFVMSCDASVADECRVNGITLGIANRVMPVPGSAPPLSMRVEEIVPAAAPLAAVARVRFAVHPETVDLLKVGDLDAGAPAVDGRAASITAIVSRQAAQGETSVEGPPDANQSQTVLRTSDRLSVVDVNLQMGVDPAQVGFHYRTRPIAAG